jgi:hypothetical protein
MFWSKNFYSCKIISSKTGLQEKEFLEKYFEEKFLVKNLLWLLNHFLENWFARKNIREKFFVDIFYGYKIIYWNTSLQEKIEKKIFSIIFYVCKTISAKKRFEKKFCEKCFGRKLFMVEKSFPPK